MRGVNTTDDIRRVLPEALISGANACSMNAVQSDSRRIQQGDIFVAIPGTLVDGHRFIDSAIAAGAAAVVCSHKPADASEFVSWIVVDDVPRANALLCAAAYGNPAEHIDVTGITGTNGKTTITWILEYLASELGYTSGVIGTTGYRWPGADREATHTTPDACVLQGLLAEMHAAGVTHAFCEFSSHALQQRRVDATRVTAAVFTNLSQDHLDYHADMEDYFQAKSRLFTDILGKGGCAIINIDSPWGQRLAHEIPEGRRVITLSTEGAKASLSVVNKRIGLNGSDITIRMSDGSERDMHVGLVGAYNLSNALQALAVGMSYGWDIEAMIAALSHDMAVPGRMEQVVGNAGISVFVDYAHTEDGLLNVLSTLRPLVDQRLICIMGCGGDRDADKRPKMGMAAAHYSDVTVITSDNPRTEDPEAIISMIIPGAQSAGRKVLDSFEAARNTDGYVVEVDRRIAIESTLQTVARPGDVVVIAGKGHEDYQIIGHTKHDFDDRKIAGAVLASMESDND